MLLLERKFHVKIFTTTEVIQKNVLGWSFLPLTPIQHRVRVLGNGNKKDITSEFRSKVADIIK